MPRKSRRATHPDRLYNINIRVSGRTKNKIRKHAKKKRLSLSGYVQYCVWQTINSELDVPPPTTAKLARPTPQDELRAYLKGETLLGPCGKADCELMVVEVGGVEFCETCNMRID